MSVWTEHFLHEVGTLKRGKSTHRPRYAFHLYGGSIPFIQTGDIKAASKYITEYSQTYSEAGLRQSRLWKKGTLCITIAANIAEIGILGFDSCFPDSVLGFTSNESKCIQDFVFYLLAYAKRELLTFADGSVQDNINLETFNKIKFLFPPIDEQVAIAEILSSLDDKIDLLTRQNSTLEALAQTYFRQWFVEEAKEDWEIGRIGDFADVSTGKGLKRDFVNEHGKYPILGANGEIGRTDKYLYDENLIITGRVGTHGKVFLVNDKVWISDNALIIKPKNPMYRYLLYFWMKGLDFNSLNVGSTQPLITQTDIKKQEILYTLEQIERFSSKVEVLFEKTERNNTQILTLQKFRDTLLPKLISGEVRICGGVEIG